MTKKTPDLDDLVFLLRARAKIETAGEPIPVSEHLDWVAAEEIVQLRKSVEGLLATIEAVEKHHPHLFD